MNLNSLWPERDELELERGFFEALAEDGADPRILEDTIVDMQRYGITIDEDEIWFIYGLLDVEILMHQHYTDDEEQLYQKVGNVPNILWSVIKQATLNMIRAWWRIQNIENRIKSLREAWENVQSYETSFRYLIRCFQEANIGPYIYQFKQELQTVACSNVLWATLQQGQKKYEQLQKIFLQAEKHLMGLLATFEKSKIKQQEREKQKTKRLAKKQQEKKLREQLLGTRLAPIVTSSQVGISETELKLHKIRTRLENLSVLASRQPLSDEQKAEINDIQAELVVYEQNKEAPELVKNTKELIASVLVQEVVVREAVVETSEIVLTHKTEREVFPVDESLRVYFEAMQTIDHSVSSTKDNWSSYGDGSFVHKIFHPVMSAMWNEILARGRLDTSHGVSWEQIVAALDEFVEDPDRARTHFLGILKKQTSQHTDYQALFYEMKLAIEEFAQSNFFKKQNGYELQNFLEHFQEIIKNI